jgi:uncharacterized protein YndB with AHSA1/START domain
MEFDIARQIGAVTRSVEARTVDGRPARAVVAERAYDTDLDDLWDAITNAERIPRWFLPVSGELRVGGHYQLEGNAGGEVTACEPPTHLALTWVFADQTSWVEVHLRDEGPGRAHLQLTHLAQIDDHWDTFGPGAVGIGWELGLLGLDLHLRSRAAVSPEEFAGWSASEEGKAFMRGSSDGWCAADIAAGTPAASARGSAERTAAFYTGDGADAGPDAGADAG